MKDGDGRTLERSPELRFLLIEASRAARPERYIQGSRIVGQAIDFPQLYESAFLSADLAAGSFTSMAELEISDDRVCIFGERSYGYNERNRHLVCLDLDLNEVWSYAPDYRPAERYVRGPELHGDSLIVSFGHSRVTRSPAPDPGDADWCHLHDALLACFAQADGAVRWQRMVAKSIDTLELVDGRLYLACDDEILVLDPDSGETLACVDTGLKADYDRSLILSSLHVEGEHLYFCHPGAALLLVYRLADLDLLRRVDIPAPYSIDRFGAAHPGTGRLYFHLSPREAPIEYFHMWPLLELDPQDLGAELRVEAGPPAQIELRPSADEPGREEVWVELAESSLDAALIYGEMHAEDQAYYHGQLTSGLMNARLTPNFNGRVHLRVRCSDATPEQVQEQLAILRQRFARWAKDEWVAAGCNPNRPVSLDVRDSRLPEPAPAAPPAKPPTAKPARKTGPTKGATDSKAKAQPLPRTLKARLIAAGMLPKSASGLGSFEDLAAALVRANRRRPTLVSVLADSDFGADGYRFYFQRLVQASGRPTDYRDIEVIAGDAGRLTLRCTHHGEPLACEWVQQTSYLAQEMIEFAERTVRHPDGRLLRLPDGESLTHLFLDADLADLIEEWRASPDAQRLAFWWREFHDPPSFDAKYPILSRGTYRRVREDFARALLGPGGGDPRDTVNYRVPAERLPWFHAKNQDYLARTLGTGSGRYYDASPNGWSDFGFSDLFPGSPVHVLVLDSSLEIVFAARTDELDWIFRKTSGDFDCLVVDRELRWSVSLIRTHLENSLVGLVVLAGEVLPALAGRIKDYEGGGS